MNEFSLDALLDRIDSDGNEAWKSFAPATSHEVFCVQFARHVARRFEAGQISFDAANSAMNGLYTYCYHLKDRGMPDPAWAVRDAFEQGEFVHDGDPSDVDPVEKYVLPKIRLLLQNKAKQGDGGD
jgi:hypothetical protein